MSQKINFKKIKRNFKNKHFNFLCMRYAAQWRSSQLIGLSIGRIELLLTDRKKAAREPI
jgi:hypothetical protein